MVYLYEILWIKVVISSPSNNCHSLYLFISLPVLFFSVTYFNTGLCAEFEQQYDARLLEAREATHLESSSVVFRWLAKAHECMYSALKMALTPALERRNLGLEMDTPMSRTMMNPATGVEFTVPESLAYPVDLIVSDIVTLAGIDAARELHVPVVLNNADLLYVNSARALPGSTIMPQMFDTNSIHAIRSSYAARLVRKAFYIPVQFIIEALFSYTAIASSFNVEREKSHLPHLDFMSANADYIVVQNTAFGIEYAQSVPPNIFMVGPCVQESQSQLSPEDKAWLSLSSDPVAFLSMGTLAQLTSDQMYRVLGGFLSMPSQNTTDVMPLRVIWKVSNDARQLLASASYALGVWIESLGDISQFPEIPPPSKPLRVIPTSRLLVTEWISSQPALLADSRVRLFVSHCGINSGHEAVLLGGGHLQVICIPMFGDQRDMATRLRDAGVGAYVEKLTFTSDEFAKMISALLVYGNSPLGRARGETARRAVMLAGGVKRAVDVISATAESSMHARRAHISDFRLNSKGASELPIVPVIDLEVHTHSRATQQELDSNPKTATLVREIDTIADGLHIVSWHPVQMRNLGSIEAADLANLLIPTESRIGLLEAYHLDAIFLCLCLFIVGMLTLRAFAFYCCCCCLCRKSRSGKASTQTKQKTN